MSNNYHKNTKALKQELKKGINTNELKHLHQKVWWKHFLILIHQIVVLFIVSIIIITNNDFYIWIPCAIISGFITFSWNPLLHEVIHECVFQKKYPVTENILGYFYGIMGGLAKTQFTHWHLQHHQELGSFEDDPKRAYLTPKVVQRWYKFLYLTPVLFLIYYRAASQETRKYSTPIQNKIKKEKRILLCFHFCILTTLVYYFQFWGAFKVYLVPYFFVFPVAFTINRLGQHYSIDPEDPAHWTTLIRSCYISNYLYVYSNLHLEHHYFPKVPCYNLPKLQIILEPIYKKHQILAQGYLGLLWNWFVVNKIPHTNWKS